MNMQLAYRVQMFPATIRGSRTSVVEELLKAGWRRDEIDADVDSAIAWANSHCLVTKQERLRKARQAKKEKVRGDDAFDAMIAAASHELVQS